ncbi:MAG: heavy metal translocating P-type ATPase [Symbiobacteriia bacterium]
MEKTTVLPLVGPGCASCAAKVETTLHREGQKKDGHDHGAEASRRELVQIGIAAPLLLVGFLFNQQLHHTPYAIAEYLILLVAYGLVGWRVLWSAVQNVMRGQLFGETFLMSVATLGAIAIHQLPEAVAVMLFYAVGEFFQGLAVSRSRRSIKALLEIRPDHASVRRDGEWVGVSPETVGIGEEIFVRPGERIPLDGTILEGSSFIDTSALTGESVPREVGVGDSVLAGTVNTRGAITVQVTRAYGESSIAKIMQLVEQASARKAPTERVLTAFSRYYTPAVVLAAIALAIVPPLLLPGATFSEWLYRALVLLVISCPCALVISVPLSYFGGIGGASRRGILVKGGNYLDALARVDTVVWDKTGTLTQGVFRVTEVSACNGFTRDEVLKLAAHVEVHSSHPIAASIQEAYGGLLEEGNVRDYEEVAGQGVKAMVGGRQVLAGNARLLARAGVPIDKPPESTGTVVYVAVGGELAGRIVIADEPKSDARRAIQTLKALGVRRQLMLTGDEQSVAQQVGDELGLDEVRANLLPEDKVAEVERIVGARGRGAGSLAFVGDGINDAPVLTRADVGVAMGGLGSDAAIEAADVVIMDDNPAKLGVAIAIARKTRQIVYQNIGFALAVKVLVISLGAVGAANMWEAVFADVGVSLLAVLNAMRVLRAGPRTQPDPVNPAQD